MKNRLLFAAVVVGAVGLAHVAGAAPAEKSAASTAPEKAWSWKLSDVKWMKDPSSPIEIATVWGDPTKGEYGALVKFPKGIKMPLHWHTYDNFVVGIQGTLTITVDGKEHAVGPNSVGFLQGKVHHTTMCGADADCIIFARQPGMDDVHIVEDKPAAPKK